jgi:hypothetical protein
VPVVVDGRTINAPWLPQIQPDSLTISADLTWLEAEQPTLTVGMPITYLPTRVALAPAPTCDLLEGANKIPSLGNPQVSQRFHQLRIPSEYSLAKRDWATDLKPGDIPLLRRIEPFKGQWELCLTSSQDFQVIAPRRARLLQLDRPHSSLPLLGARLYAGFQPNRPGGWLHVVQDGLTHQPLETGVEGLTLVLGARGLPIDANGLSPVRGEALHSLVQSILPALLEWQGAGMESEAWARLGSQLPRLASLSCTG